MSSDLQWANSIKSRSRRSLVLKSHLPLEMDLVTHKNKDVHWRSSVVPFSSIVARLATVGSCALPEYRTGFKKIGSRLKNPDFILKQFVPRKKQCWRWDLRHLKTMIRWEFVEMHWACVSYLPQETERESHSERVRSPIRELRGQQTQQSRELQRIGEFSAKLSCDYLPAVHVVLLKSLNTKRFICCKHSPKGQVCVRSPDWKPTLTTSVAFTWVHTSDWMQFPLLCLLK